MASSSNDGVAMTSQIISTIYNARKAIEESAIVTTEIAQSIRNKKDQSMVDELEDAIMQFAKFDRQLDGWSQVIDRNRHTLAKYSQSQNDANDQQQMDSHQDIHEIIRQECQQSSDNITDSHVLAHRFIKEYQDVTGFIVGDDMTDDITATQSQRSTKCPVTLKEMEDPVKSLHCKHTYSRQGILQHINNCTKSNRRSVCPVAGCKQFVSEQDLIPDEHMQVPIRSNPE